MRLTKICTKCGERVPRDNFGKHAGRADGLNDRCKPCHRAESLNAMNAKKQRDRQQGKNLEAEKLRVSSPTLNKHWRIPSLTHLAGYRPDLPNNMAVLIKDIEQPPVQVLAEHFRPYQHLIKWAATAALSPAAYRGIQQTGLLSIRWQPVPAHWQLALADRPPESRIQRDSKPGIPSRFKH